MSLKPLGRGAQATSALHGRVCRYVALCCYATAGVACDGSAVVTPDATNPPPEVALEAGHTQAVTPDAVAATVLQQSAAPSGAPAQPLAKATPAQVQAQAEPAAPALHSELPAAPTARHAVGTVRIELDVAEARRIPVQLWYPASESARLEAEAGRPVLEFEPEGTRERQQLAKLTNDAGPIYSQRTMHAANAPEVLSQADRFPLVLISHCNDCTRYTYFEVAEELAARGFVVAAPDHVGNTLYNFVAGDSVGLELNVFLETRRLDMYTLTDRLLDAEAQVIPSGLRGRIDPARVGMAGHSFGALTTSYASTRDPRIRAVAFLAMLASLGDNLPVLGDQLAQQMPPVKLSKPAFFLLATEDGINLFGLDELIRQNYADYPTETWLATLQDTGHYSVTNICGIAPGYENGCGDGFRTHEFLVPFTYLNIDTATSLTAALVATYFELQLNGASAQSLDEIASGASQVLRMEHRVPQ